MKENWNLSWEKIFSSQGILIDLLRNLWPNFTVVNCNSKIFDIYHHIIKKNNKISEKYNEQVFYKKAVLKNFSIFSLQFCNFIKKRLQHGCFPMNIAKFLRTPVLKNICERLFDRFPTWTNNVTRNTGRKEDIFSKNKTKKNHSKIQLDEKKLAFSWCSWSFPFSLFLHCMSGGVCPT